MKNNATVEITEVDPAQAKVWLGNRHSGQRKVRDSWVEKLAAEMKDGKFVLSCDALVLVKNTASEFNNSYTLANGQHRLQAVVESGVSCEFLVMKTDDPAIYEVIDAGIKRTVADVISGDYASMVASIGHLVCAYMNNRLTINSSGHARTLRSEVVDFCKDNLAELQRTASMVCGMYAKNRFVTASIGGAMAFVANLDYPGKGDEFMRMVYEGGTVPPVVNDIRNRLINDRVSRAGASTSYKLGLLIKAFNSWQKGTRPGNYLIAASEEFPAIMPKQKEEAK